MSSSPPDPLEAAFPQDLRDVHVDTRAPRPDLAGYDLSATGGDDAHITLAACTFHPLLFGTDAIGALLLALGPVRPVSAGTLIELDGRPAGAPRAATSDPSETGIHLLTQGRAQLVATFGKRRRVLGEYRCGQWIGLPELLRRFDTTSRRRRWPEPHVRLEAELLGDAGSQSMTMDQALQIMATSPDFVRFVEHQVAVRFARRREMLDRFRANPLLRLLSAVDRDYALQLGCVVRAPVDGRSRDAVPAYLPAATTSGRAALLLRGDATVLVPGADAAGSSALRVEGAPRLRYAATLRPGDLMGHEGLVMPDEWPKDGAVVGRYDGTLFAPEEPASPALPVRVAEPPRTTEVRLAPGAEVFEMAWYGLRWLLDDRDAVWERVKSVLAGGEAGSSPRMPTIVTFHAAKAGLGTTTLAYGTAAALAASPGNGVVVLDLGGAANFTRWASQGFEATSRTILFQSGVRTLRATGRPTEIGVAVLKPPQDGVQVDWPKDLYVVWPLHDAVTADDLEQLVMGLAGDFDLSHVVIAGREQGGPVGDVLARLEGYCSVVFHVCDDVDAVYGGADPHRLPAAEPDHLTWVYRITPAYRDTERRRAAGGALDWLLAGVIDAAPAPVQAVAKALLGRDPSTDLERETTQSCRRVVRVTDDAEGAALCDRGAFGRLVGPDARDVPLARAFARLARVVSGTTVGLALGGGGAWGFSHVALLRNLEATKVPIDYIAGTSFGSVVGALYAVGGMPALDRLVAENSATAGGIAATLRAILTGPMNRALFVAPFWSGVVERFVDAHLAPGGDAPCLGVTEIPFCPVGTNLGAHEPIMLPHATAGRGVRMSGSLPPMFASMLRRYDRVADGAFVANVPSRVVREMGAHFVIAANVVPPPAQTGPKSLAWILLGGLPAALIERLEDTVRGVFVLAWKAGQDQGALAADHALDLLPETGNSFEMWRGRDIVEQIDRDHFSEDRRAGVSEAWSQFCDAKLGRLAGATDPAASRPGVPASAAGDGAAAAASAPPIVATSTGARATSDPPPASAVPRAG